MAQVYLLYLFNLSLQYLINSQNSDIQQVLYARDGAGVGNRACMNFGILSYDLFDVILVQVFSPSADVFESSGNFTIKESKNSHQQRALSSRIGHALRGHPEPVLNGPDDIRRLLQRLSIHDTTEFELEEIFDEAQNYMQHCTIIQTPKPQVSLLNDLHRFPHTSRLLNFG